MSTTPPESVNPAERLNEALIAFTGCIGESLDDICSYGLTIGETYVPFDPDPGDDCDEEEAICSQAWVRVVGVDSIFNEEGFGGSGCGTTSQLTLEVGVIRCIDVAEGGEAPSATEVLAAAMRSMADMKIIECAAMDCEVWDSIVAQGWSPMGPLGGQYGGMWTFTVQV